MRPLTVLEIVGLRQVKRWHTKDTLRIQDLASHSATVALLSLRIGGAELSMEDRLSVLMLGLHHDAHEVKYGDCPSPARLAYLALGIDLDAVAQEHFWGEVNPLGCFHPLVHDLVAVADKVDAALFAQANARSLWKTINREAEATAMALLSDEHRWGMRSRALAILKEHLDYA